MLRLWIEETHSSAFELRRHFFLHFFESELIADASQAKIVAGGALGILLSVSLIFGQAYFHKYRMLCALPSPEPYHQAMLADVLFIITLLMTFVALFTTLQWPALFPGLRDYLALAALPVSMRQVFVAKFTALMAFALAAIVGSSLPPSILVPAMMDGPCGSGTGWHVPGIFAAALLGGLFVFFTLVALQGLLLNLLPIRAFPRVSLVLQGLLLAVLLGGSPLLLWIPGFRIEDLPRWSAYAPPLWFFAIDQRIAAPLHEPNTGLAHVALFGLLASAAAALLTYFWSYRRHRVRVLEAPSRESAARFVWSEGILEHLIRNPRSLGVFEFIVKNLARSRQHRLILTAFAALAVAVVSNVFASTIFSGRDFHAISPSVKGARESIVAIPISISLLLLTGFRYLFRLPVELRANWIFRITEPGHALVLLGGVDWFLIVCGALPVAIVPLPIETSFLGSGKGLCAALASFLISLLLIEFLLFTFEKIPFTSTYVPGRVPLIESVIKVSVSAICYVVAFTTLLSMGLRTVLSSLLLISALVCCWWCLRRTRTAARQIRRLEFEETLEPAVQILAIQRE